MRYAAALFLALFTLSACSTAASLSTALAKDFPPGSARAEVEKYLLASDQLKPSKEAKLGPVDPERKAGAEYRVFYLKETLMRCTFGVIALYDATNLLIKTPYVLDECDGL